MKLYYKASSSKFLYYLFFSPQIAFTVMWLVTSGSALWHVFYTEQQHTLLLRVFTTNFYLFTFILGAIYFFCSSSHYRPSVFVFKPL